ncbi:MAG: 2,5-diamino-6-(ribosylamino)-4(3H)-pyrimidinone 5'-phosphate reductase [Claussenomyces sp. TS43310]|nr:MAG: 2,5-diamino-6-(ribosylamino)-4(3H)-pyrimidinone 5'-phosphate reductase [Claussenomyces sp. TS43310]
MAEDVKPTATESKTSGLTVPETHRFTLEPYLPRRDSNGAIDGSSPHLTLTYAQSLDAQISLSHGIQTVLSGSETKAMTHYLRSRHDAILVGIGTAEADDPSLNCRYSEDGRLPAGYERQPIPVILDPGGRWGCREESKVLRLALQGLGKPPLWLVSHEATDQCDSARLSTLNAAGGELLSGPSKTDFPCWDLILDCLSQRGIKSVMVEGGGKIIENLLLRRNQALVDSVIVTIAPVWLGKGGVTASPNRADDASKQEVGRLQDTAWLPMGNDVVVAGRFARRS